MMEERKYYAHNFTRVDARGAFVEMVDSALGIEKVLINFVKYNPQTNKQELFIPIYMDIEEFYALSNRVCQESLIKKTKMQLKAGDQKAVFSTLSGYNLEKTKNMLEKLRGIKVEDGKCLSKTFEVIPSTKSDFLLRATYKQGREADNGLIIPEGKALAYIQIPMSHDQLVGMCRRMDDRIRAFEMVKMFIYQTEYDF